MSGGISFFFHFLYFERTRPIASTRQPCLMYLSTSNPMYGAPTVVESTHVPGEVVALIRYRGLQFSSFCLGQGESPPRVSVEMREKEYE